MNAKAKQLGLKNTRFREPTGLSVENVSTPRETIAMLKKVIAHPILGPITHRPEYEAHPVGKPPIKYINTDRRAARSNVQLLGGKTGYNDFARYCLVVATKIDGRTIYMSFLGDEGELTRFGDVARVADWIVAQKPKTPVAAAPPTSAGPVPAGTTPAVAPASPVAPAPTATRETKPVATATAGDAKPAQPPIPIGVAVPPPAQPQQTPTATP
jgi:D-alanyl-D-alanine carboxypeptidase